MRYVPRDGFEPTEQWKKKAATVLEQLKQAPDRETRKAIIASNSKLWGQLKKSLLGLSDGKCWFSEAKDCFNYWHVEHYRPKTSALDLDGTEHDGYWWLAFDWMNYQICGGVGNRAKGTFFPLKSGTARSAGPNDDVRPETRLLLDPVDEYDPTLLSFDLEGAAIVAAHVDNDWERSRVEYSIKRLNLNYPPLADRRKVIYQECWRRIQEYRKELQLSRVARGANPIAGEGVRRAARAMRAMMRGEPECSSAARAAVWNSGDESVRALLRNS